MLTGLAQMSKIYELNELVIHDFKQHIPDNLNAVQEK